MRKVVGIAVFALLSVLAFSHFAEAVTVSDGGDFIVVQTANYEVHWKKAAQMGYATAIVGGNELMGGDEGRRLYHSANYSGWKDWGALDSWQVLEESPGKAVVEFVSIDGDSKEYTVTATYYDAVEFIRHEVTTTNIGGAAVPSFSDGHEPMFEPRVTTQGVEAWDAPIPHVAFWTDNGYGALYTETGTARAHATWQDDGRIDLVHDDLGVDLNAGETSDPIVYWVAFGTGGSAEATALAAQVMLPVEVETSVEARDKLATKWATVKSRR